MSHKRLFLRFALVYTKDMTIELKPTKIKQSFYLLIPKDIANLIDIEDNSMLSLDIKNSDKVKILEYRLK